MLLVHGVEGYQSLARLLLDALPTTEGYKSLTRLLTGSAAPLPTSVLEGKLWLLLFDYISFQQVRTEFSNACEKNQWLKTLELSAETVDGMVSMLELALLLSKLKELTVVMGRRDNEQAAAMLQGVASFVSSLSLPVAAQSSLQHLQISGGRFGGDNTPLWNALEHNKTLQEITVKSGRFDADNAMAFADCFNNTEKVLSICGGGGGTFDGTTVGDVCARMWAHPTQLKALKLDEIGSEPDLATKFEPFVNALMQPVGHAVKPPKLEWTMNDDGLIELVTAGLPNFTNLRELLVKVHPADPIAAMKALMAALKKNGSLHSVRFTYDKDGRRDLTFGEVFQDAICQRNQRVPKLLLEARKQDERPNPIVEEQVSKLIVPTLSLAGIQSPRMAFTTLVAAFSSWEGIGN